MNHRHKTAPAYPILCVSGLLFLCGCGGGSPIAPPPLPPAPLTSITITQVSPNPVDTGEALGVTFSGPDPSTPGNPIVATFQQGSLPKQNGKFLGADNLGSNQFRAFYQVPGGLGADAGALAIPMQVTLSNQQASSTAQNIQVAPPPSLVVFPQEIYLGDSNRILRVSGIHTHFDATTVVNAPNGLQVNSSTVLSAQEIQIDVTVTATGTAGLMLQVQSGGTDPKTTETIVGPMSIAARAAPIFGATALSVTDAPPGTVLNVSGLFSTGDQTQHNLVQWDIAGHSATMYPADESHSNLDVMVPLWTNSDGSLYTGPAVLKVIASGNTTTFAFTIDALPQNNLAPGTVTQDVLSFLQTSITNLGNVVSGLSLPADRIQAYQTVTTQVSALITQMQQWKDAAASGQTVKLPGGQVTLTPAALNLMEQLLLSAGIHTQATGIASSRASLQGSAGLLSSDLQEADVALACQAGDKVSLLSSTLSRIATVVALVSAATGDVPLAAAFGGMAVYLANASTVLDLLEGLCHVFPVVLTNVALTPAASHLSNALGGNITYQVLGTFNGCGDPTTLFIYLWDKVIEHELETVGINLDPETWKLINDATKALFAGVVKDFIETILQPLISKVLAVQLQAIPPQQLLLTTATIALQSTVPPVASPIPNTLQVQPQGPGLTTIYADLSKFLLGSHGNACNPTSPSTNVQGNAASLTIDGPPITIPTGSGSSVGLVPVTTGGVTIEKGYIPIPGLQVVAVVDAGAPLGAAPLGSVPMPFSFVPNSTAADPLNKLAYVTSYTSNAVIVIDATTDTIQTTLNLPVTHSYQFSFSSCMVCGAVVDFQNNLLIFDTADGYVVYSNGTLLPLIATFPAENFGYDQTSHQIFSPFYAKFNTPANPLSGLQAIDAAGNQIETFSGTVGDVPDAAAVDPTTRIVVVANEPFTSTTPTGLLNFINLGAESVNAGTFSAPSFSFSFPDTSGSCSGFSQDEQNEWTMPAIDSVTHTLFVASEFSNCIAALDMQPIQTAGVPRAGATFRFSPMPISPDGVAWSNSIDPHGTAVFVSVVDGKSYGFLVRQDALYVARVDLQGFLSAPTITGSNGLTDVSPFVTFLRTR